MKFTVLSYRRNLNRSLMPIATKVKLRVDLSRCSLSYVLQRGYCHRPLVVKLKLLDKNNVATATPLVKLGHCPLPTWPLPHCLLIKLIHCINTGSNIFIFLVVTRMTACKKETSFGKRELVHNSERNLSFGIFMFNVYLENRYRCRAVVIWNFPASDLNQYIQLHDNRVTRVQFCKRASSVTK